ncbi:MAG: hypothetical protein WKF89_15015 [Chitinophagaceae bacterium]
MHKISNAAELKAAIRELELKTQQQKQALKTNATSTAKSFNPANLVRTGLLNAKEVAEKRDIRATALNTLIGLGTGYLSRKLVVGKSRNIFRRTIGTAVQAAMTKFIFRKLPVWQQQTARLINNVNTNKKISQF